MIMIWIILGLVVLAFAISDFAVTNKKRFLG